MASAVNANKDLKFDQGKPKMDLLFEGCPNALKAVGEVLTFGAQKYEAHSWQKVAGGPTRYKAALIRHLLEEGNDSESGLPHLAHAACNALFILELALSQQKYNFPTEGLHLSSTITIIEDEI